LHEGVERASVFSDFVTTEDISLGVGVGFTVFPYDGGSEFIVVLLQELLEFEHVSHLCGGRDKSPGLEGLS